MRGLEGKRVVVTGGARGIGAATVERFRAEGSLVTVFDLEPGDAGVGVDVSDGAPYAPRSPTSGRSTSSCRTRA